MAEHQHPPTQRPPFGAFKGVLVLLSLLPAPSLVPLASHPVLLQSTTTGTATPVLPYTDGMVSWSFAQSDSEFPKPVLPFSGIQAHLKSTYTYGGVLGFGNFGLVVKVWHMPSRVHMALKVVHLSPDYLVRMEAVALMLVSESRDPRARHLATMFEFLTVPLSSNPYQVDSQQAILSS